MPPKVNLLPYRAERRKALAKRFFIFLGLGGALAAGVIMLVHSFYGVKIASQETRNNVLESRIKLLDKEIEEIKRLREDTAAMISRKQVVESLQANRSRAVMLLNQIVQPPGGVFYKGLKQTGTSVTLSGIAMSNTAVSTLIKQIETSDILRDPRLVETKAVVIDGAKLVEFTMQAGIIDLAKLAQEKQKKEAGAKPGAPSAPAAVIATPVATVIATPAAAVVAVPSGTAVIAPSNGKPAVVVPAHGSAVLVPAGSTLVVPAASPAPAAPAATLAPAASAHAASK